VNELTRNVYFSHLVKMYNYHEIRRKYDKKLELFRELTLLCSSKCYGGLKLKYEVHKRKRYYDIFIASNVIPDPGVEKEINRRLCWSKKDLKDHIFNLLEQKVSLTGNTGLGIYGVRNLLAREMYGSLSFDPNDNGWSGFKIKIARKGTLSLVNNSTFPIIRL